MRKLSLENRIEVLSVLGDFLSRSDNPAILSVIDKAAAANPWFNQENCLKSFAAVSKEYLDHSKLRDWVSNYQIADDDPRTIGIVMAGNIPMVGFHDLLASFVSGHRVQMKCSSKDDILIPWIVDKLGELEPDASGYFEKVEKLSGFDAVIATGGDTAATHFRYYFSKYPHLIRKNRSSVAILDEKETVESIEALGADIFDYFGLGCRSISKIFIPESFNTDRIFEGLFRYANVIDHNKYKNNYDYSYAIYVLGQEPILTNGFIILRESQELASRISCLHYERYDDIDSVRSQLNDLSENIQVISTREGSRDRGILPFGQSQRPGLSDYADGVDTMEFLTNLGNS
jgi:hypothetical protein